MKKGLSKSLFKVEINHRDGTKKMVRTTVPEEMLRALMYGYRDGPAIQGLQHRGSDIFTGRPVYEPGYTIEGQAVDMAEINAKLTCEADADALIAVLVDLKAALVDKSQLLLQKKGVGSVFDALFHALKATPEDIEQTARLYRQARGYGDPCWAPDGTMYVTPKKGNVIRWIEKENGHWKFEEVPKTQNNNNSNRL